MGWLLRILKPKRWRKDMSVRVRTVEKLAGKYSTRRCVDARRRGPCTGRHALCVPKSRFSWELGKTRMGRPTQPILWGDAEGPTDDLFCISERL